MKKIFLLIVLLLVPLRSRAQYLPGQTFTVVPILPSICTMGAVLVTTTSPGLYLCTATNIWTSLSGQVPSGTLLVIITGTCPSGFTESSALNGKFLRGTIASNNDVGTSAGSDSLAPSGTNSTVSFTPSGSVSAPTFTGNAVISSATSAGTPAGTNSSTITSGNCAATNVAIGTGATNACKATAPNLTVPAEVFSGSALSTHTHTTTATGSNSTPSFTGTLGTIPAETFTGTTFDNRPAFTKVIFCQKN